MNNWCDIREGKEHPRNTVAWCHGSAGILLARALIHKISGLTMDQLFKDIPLNQVIDQMLPDRKNRLVFMSWAGRSVDSRKIYSSCLCVMKKKNGMRNAAKYLDKRLSIEDVLNYGMMQRISWNRNFPVILGVGKRLRQKIGR